MHLKRFVWMIWAVCTALGLEASTAWAVSGDDFKPKNSFYFDIGGSTPFAPDGFKDSWTTGISGGAGFGFGLSKLFAIVLDANYNSFPVKSTQIGYPGIVFSGGAVHLFTFLGNVKFKFVGEDNPVIPYAILGLGGASFTSDPLTGTNGIATATTNATSLSETDFAFRLGVGIDIKLSEGTYLFVESNGVGVAVSNMVSTEGSLTYNMARLGMKLDM